MTDQTARTPYCHKIRYGITGAPELPGCEGSYAPEITIAPKVIEFVYSVAREGQPACVDAAVTGSWMRDGERVLPDREITHHYAHGPEGWPGWLVEEARLHDPVVPAPATDQTVLRDRIAALFRHPPGEERLGDATPGEIADAVMAVLPATVDRAAVRAAALHEGADALLALDPAEAALAGQHAWADGAALLRRLAEARQDDRFDVGSEFVRQADKPNEAGLTAWETDVAREARQEPTQDGEQPTLRERHRAAWTALTPAEQAAQLDALDAIDDDAAQSGQPEPKTSCDCPPTQAGLELCPACPGHTAGSGQPETDEEA